MSKYSCILGPNLHCTAALAKKWAVQQCTLHSALNSAENNDTLHWLGLLLLGVDFVAAGGRVCCCRGLSLLLPGFKFAASSLVQVLGSCGNKE